jgi:hypothetical protein
MNAKELLESYALGDRDFAVSDRSSNWLRLERTCLEQILNYGSDLAEITLDIANLEDAGMNTC